MGPAPDEVLHLPFVDECAAEARWPTRQRHAGPAAFAAPSSACTAHAGKLRAGFKLGCREVALISDECYAERGDAQEESSGSEVKNSVSSRSVLFISLWLWADNLKCCTVGQLERSMYRSGYLQACD